MAKRTTRRLTRKEGQAALWSARVLESLRLPDERLVVRALAILTQKALRPGDSILQGAEEPADAKACYRYLENPRVSAQPHWNALHQHTAKGLRGLRWVVSVQDTTTLMFPGLKATTGLGTVDQPREEALWMHSALAVRPDGHVLGLLHNPVWARPLSEFGKGHKRKQRPFEDKESFEWVRGMRHTGALRDRYSPKTTLVHVFDSAGDVHEVLAEVAASGDDAVIRSARNRRVQGPHKHLRETLAAAPLLQRCRLDLPRSRGKRKRRATVEVRSATVSLDPPADGSGRGPVTVNAVWVHEPKPPQGAGGIEWLLLTTRAVATAKQALKVVELYKLRWRVEEFHLVLKSGCKIEKTQLKTAERIETWLSLLSAVAVRVLQLAYLARTDPEAPCTVVLDDDEWRVLWAYIHKRPAIEARAPPTLYEAVRMIGRLGGHLGRKGDGMPGARSLWRGWRDLCLLVEGFHVAGL